MYGVTALFMGGLLVVLARRVRVERFGERAERAAKGLFALLDPLSLRSLRRALDRGRPGRAPRPRDDFADLGDAMADECRSIVLTEEQKRKRRGRSIAIAVALGVLVALFYIVTLVKGPGVLNRPCNARSHRGGRTKIRRGWMQ